MAAYTTIDDPSAYFKVQLYSGNGAANNAITFDDTDTNMQPDLVWIKNREQTDSNGLFDSVRGATKVLPSDANSAEVTDTDTLDSFASDGFQVDADVKVNTDGEGYVAWCWKESATAGFDIVIYTGNGTDDTDIAHSLSAVPHLMIVRCRSDDEGWMVYHHKNTSAPETDYLELNNNNATADAADKWSDEAPTSSVFTLGDNNSHNGDSRTYVNYLFSEKQGFSKFGTYTGNADADGTFIYTGFRPAYIICKISSGTEDWRSWDNKREGYNPTNDSLSPSRNWVEAYGGTAQGIDIVSNGFKCRITNTEVNGASTYIYIAFAEAPFVNSNGVPCNAR